MTHAVTETAKSPKLAGARRRVQVIRFLLLVAGVLGAPGDAWAFSDEDFCRAMQERARTTNFHKPAWVDREIRDDGMTVHCVQRTLEFRRYFNVDTAGLGLDWERRLAGQWSLAQCREPMLSAIQNGWQIVEITRFPKTRRLPEGQHLRAVATCR